MVSSPPETVATCESMAERLALSLELACTTAMMVAEEAAPPLAMRRVAEALVCDVIFLSEALTMVCSLESAA